MNYHYIYVYIYFFFYVYCFYAYNFEIFFMDMETYMTSFFRYKEMVEEAEIAGELFLKAGVVENSRCAWSLATQFYSETYNYVKLSSVYNRLALVVSSKVPVVDTSNQLELSSSLGRFYRVWFHGGAPDELIGTDFVHRANQNVKLEEFGTHIKNVIQSLLPEDTPIDLFLDDGRPEEPPKRQTTKVRMAPGSSLEPIKIKVTPLRPMIKGEINLRGSSEWFNNYIETPDIMYESKQTMNNHANANVTMLRPPHNHEKGNLKHTPPIHQAGSRSSDSDYRTFSFSNSLPNIRERFGKMNDATNCGMSGDLTTVVEGGSLIGVDRFHYTQPKKKDRRRGTRDYLKSSSGDFAEKNLRVTQLQVQECFPACVSRQVVQSRTVFFQSPLEAGVEAVCSWCAVLFRTAVASNGLAVLGKASISKEQGIGTAVMKVVADCIHCSRVKEMGQYLLKRNRYVVEEDEAGESLTMDDRLSEEEIMKNQEKLARGIVIFMELLHLLIVRNRDLLLAVAQARKRDRDRLSHSHSHSHNEKRETKSLQSHRGMSKFNYSNPSSPDSIDRHRRMSSSHSVGVSVASSEGMSTVEGSQFQSSAAGKGMSQHQSTASMGNFSIGSWSVLDRTDSSFVVQSELQRSFLSMAKALYPIISNVIREETPRWLRLCSRTDGYFSSGSYRNTRISIGEELIFPRGDTSSSANYSKAFPNIINAGPGLGPGFVPGPGLASGLAPGVVPGSYHRSTASPNGSYAGSAASRNSEPRKETHKRSRTPTSSLTSSHQH